MVQINKRRSAAYILCLIVAFIWGFGFLAVPIALEAGATPSLIGFFRFALAALLFLVVFNRKIKIDNTTLKACILPGVLLFVGFILQLTGQKYTSPAHSAFITTLAPVLVPFASWIFIKRKPTVFVYISAVMFCAGVFLLCFDGQEERFVFNLGDLLTVGGAVMFALHYTSVSFAIRKVDSITLNFLQFCIAAVLFGGYYLVADAAGQMPIEWGTFILCALFVGVLCSAFAYSVQVFAQKELVDYHVSLILSLENVSGTVFSVLLGYDEFGWNIVLGGGLMVAAMLFVTVAPRFFKNVRNYEED